MLPLCRDRRDKEREQLDELLSAYLDGELSDAEQASLNARLSKDPALRAELRAMHHTVSLLRELPAVTAPRNFLVTGSVAEQRQAVGKPCSSLRTDRERRRWMAPVLTAASALTSLLFVLVLLGDLLLPGVGGLASAPPPVRHLEQPERMAVEGGPTQEVEAPDVETLDQASPSPVAPLAETDDLAQEEKRTIEEESTAVAATRAAEAPAGMGEGPPAEEGVPREEMAVFSAPTTPSTVTAVNELTPTIAAESPTLSEGEPDGVGVTPDQLVGTPQLDRTTEETEVLGGGALRWTALELSLGLLSLGLIVATVVAWRRRPR